MRECSALAPCRIFRLRPALKRVGGANGAPGGGAIGNAGTTLFTLASLLVTTSWVQAHIVPPEQLHPVTESYRRMHFMLSLNPVRWEEVRADVRTIIEGLARVDAEEAEEYRAEVDSIFSAVTGDGVESLSPKKRKIAAKQVFEICTTSVAETLVAHLNEAGRSVDNYSVASQNLDQARRLWASFEHEVRSSDPAPFTILGRAWLELTTALGTPERLQAGSVEPDAPVFRRAAEKIIAYVQTNFGDGFQAPPDGKLVPLPAKSETFNPHVKIPVRLPPGANINKQLPRPRQILNMAERGVYEGETTLIALGDMAFDSSYVFGEPARSLQISCNTCHNKSITNPGFVIPGLSSTEGGLDVSNSFFAPHANNGHFDALDIPDLRGIRFTAPYGRNGRFASLREFIRNVIVNEFSGPEPDPMMLDGMIAYMLEFDFLPNPMLKIDGTLNEKASRVAKRGEKIFTRPFRGMGGQSCATCHVPSANFVDHKRHDIGTVKGVALYSRDRTMDTPTLLGIKYTAPNFHDGSQPTLRAVNDWFNERFNLRLSERELMDLTVYMETVGDGLEAYEDTMHTLEAELEEFLFFLSGHEYLRQMGKSELISITLQTIASEIRAHKWDLQHDQYMPILNRLADLMDEAYQANQQSDFKTVDAKVAEYRRLYEENSDKLN